MRKIMYWFVVHLFMSCIILFTVTFDMHFFSGVTSLKSISSFRILLLEVC